MRENSVNREQRCALVTGSSGYIGRALVRQLYHHYDRVVGVDVVERRLPDRSERHRFLDDDRSRFYVADIRDALTLTDLFRRHRPDVVFHLAAKTGVRSDERYPGEFHDVNVNGTQIVARCAQETNVSRFLFASSSSVYGNAPATGSRETDALAPQGLYSDSKAEAERLLAEYFHQDGLEVRMARLFTVYGGDGRPDMAIPRFCSQALSGGNIVVTGDGEQERDWNYLTDTVQALVTLAQIEEAPSIVNMGTGKTNSVNRVIELIEQFTGHKINMERVSPHPSEVRRTCADTTRARSSGISNPTVLEQGLQQTVCAVGHTYDMQRHGDPILSNGVASHTHGMS